MYASFSKMDRSIITIPLQRAPIHAHEYLVSFRAGFIHSHCYTMFMTRAPCFHFFDVELCFILTKKCARTVGTAGV